MQEVHSAPSDMNQSNEVSHKRTELRQHHRRRVPPACLVSFAPFALSISFCGDTEGEGLVINLSNQGCKVESDAGVRVGDAMSLIMLLPGEQSPTLVDLALVRWASGQWFGLEFVSLGAAEMNRLRGFLASALASEE